jgi:two-component system, OmpR family, sensor histidine kinase VanS
MPPSEKRTSESGSTIDEMRNEIESLRESVKRVERERIEYLQNVSHQIVAPLNAMKWHIENLTEVRVPLERVKKVLRSIYSQATLAVHLAKNFRLMSNLEGDHTLALLREPLQEVELRRLLVNLADDFQPLGWDQELEIVVDDQHFDNGPAVLAIKPLISQVFSNILENAVKYSNKRTSIVATGQHLGSQSAFAVEIRNRGIPLGPGEAEKVFERTYRSPEAKRRYPAGTGFGLYIAKRIVEIHEGSITARTDQGWTVFKVVLSVSGLKGKARLFRE